MRHLQTASTRAAAALVGLIGLVGCGATAPDPAASSGPPLSTATAAEPSASASAPSTSTSSGPSGEGDGGAAFVPLDQPGEAPGAGASSVVDVRAGEHDGYERVVVDLEGAPGETAGWYVSTVDQPVQEASGELLDVEGDRFLDLAVTGVANGGEGQVDSAGRQAYTGTVDGSGDLVDQVLAGGAWEGQAQVLVGLDDAVTEYRVLRLTGPQRIVVDVR